MKMEKQEPTKISAKVESRVNLGGYNNFIQVSIWVEDRVREGVDESTGAAIDRVYGLVEQKVAEKLSPYKEIESTDE